MTLPPSAELSPEQITRQSRSSFRLSFLFLARSRRSALAAIYAFCRNVDDAADETDDPVDAAEQLAFWRAELERVVDGTPRTPTGVGLQAAVADFGVRIDYLREIIDGVTMDLEARRFADLATLEQYCYLVAAAVGLACLPVFGATGEAAERYADRLGQALQLTNILRDLRSDAENGRVYVPADALARAGVESDWLRGDGPAFAYADGGPVHQLVEELAGVAQLRFDQASEALPGAQRRALLPAEIMGAVYSSLLFAVRRRRGRIDQPGRLRISTRRKLVAALRTWWRCRR